MSLHECEGRLPEDGYGEAINTCSEVESPLAEWRVKAYGYERYKPGQFWVGNGEYGSQVNFCPYCGAKAPVQVETIEKP